MRVSLDIRGGGVDGLLVSPALAMVGTRDKKKKRIEMRRAFMNHPRGRYSLIIDPPFGDR
jgi:hypothetical protein